MKFCTRSKCVILMNYRYSADCIVSGKWNEAVGKNGNEN